MLFPEEIFLLILNFSSNSLSLFCVSKDFNRLCKSIFKPDIKILRKCSENNDINGVKSLMKYECINEIDLSDLYIVLRAFTFENKNIEIIKLLFKKYIDIIVKHRTFVNEDLLVKSIRINDYELVKLFSDYTCEINLKYKERKNEELIKLLEDKCCNNDIDLFKSLNLKILTNSYFRVMKHAARLNCVKILKLLLKHSNIFPLFGDSYCLEKACMRDSVKIVKLIFDHELIGANYISENNYEIIRIAIEYKSTQTLKFLLSYPEFDILDFLEYNKKTSYLIHFKVDNFPYI